MLNLRHFLYDFFIENGLTEDTAKYLNMLGLLLALLLLAFIVDYITKRFLWHFSAGIAKRTKTGFDDILITNKLPRNIAHIIPLLILIEFVPQVFTDFEYAKNIIEKTLQIIAIVLTLQIIRSILSSIKDYLKTLSRYKDKPIDSYVQVFMIFAWLLGFFSIIAIITGVSFIKFATTLGAASAVILLIFKDTILGFVASIQVSINDMVRIGDWITFDKYGADGDVIEINLATVKVQNWDKTITTIPTYALISDSFKNWRGMLDSGGRRIKRSVIVKTSTIKFLTDEDIERFSKIQLITDYLETRAKDIKAHNSRNNIDKSVLINGRNLTNFGVFRKYLQTYIENHSALNKDMTLMVRQLEPTPQGIPMEVYAFSKDQRWANYEYILGDIFDHILASVKFFDLEIYELSLDKHI
ncbi:miniconductance mechanosensitive channel [Winogradskyella epiphytica]|uniref:Mechanosensing system component YbdG n=1 Tax=Winogradskyella epiphytica TaxID=262005 RepID=A0A2V4WWQ4_9FLAO|nr:mechanosensitive ion channel domain-containing protein [Winogradskyella epiphytica]PYE81666.1 miniconductance mechanosensitive channel [Winogradskyella epiphytica]GGW63514.1 mechanosensitive ion channel protein MscS [Winogradskyella epiphytica]